jgi:sirohydrochlorin cobaltochelatase
MSTGLLIVGHGSRDSQANLEFEALVAAYRLARPTLTVTHGYVELAQPSLAMALHDLAQQTDTVVVLPYFSSLPATSRTIFRWRSLQHEANFLLPVLR